MNILLDENELINSFHSGGHSSYEIIYERYYTRLTVFSYKIIENEVHAQDIASETIFKSFERRDSFNSFWHLERFLYLNARTSCISYLRDQSSAETKTGEYIQELTEFNRWDLVNAQLNGEAQEKIYQAIQKLPPRARLVIDLLFIRRLTCAKAAEMLRMTEKNIENIRDFSLRRLIVDLSRLIDPKDLSAVFMSSVNE